jgi:dipeptidase D
MEATQRILHNFEQISAVPRGTNREEKIRSWLQNWAAAHRLASRVDAVGNLVMRVPGTKGRANEPVVILQGHLDMVCEKTPDSPHDFLTDPIRCIVEGEWLHADRTTLGADNGIAIAIAMTLVEDQDVSHPPLELLFTVEEEIGIGGATGLDPDLITGRTMINLDSEDEGSFIVGCAGGMTTFIHLPADAEPVPLGKDVFKITVGGLLGGHSGVDIHKFRGNAIKVMARTLDRIAEIVPIRLVALKGGSARNAIPRDAQAAFACPGDSAGRCREQFVAAESEMRDEYARTDGGLGMSFESEQATKDAQGLNPEKTRQVVHMLMALPHGVIQMSPDIEGFVETSTNLAMVELTGDGLHVTTNQRSSVNSKRDEVNRRVEAVARLAGAQVNHTEGYLAWQPDMDSPVLKTSVKVYESLFGSGPQVKTIHAGLECGIIEGRCGGLDMISLGPTIQNPHSPDERLYIPSVARVWQFLLKLLESSL